MTNLFLLGLLQSKRKEYVDIISQIDQTIATLKAPKRTYTRHKTVKAVRKRRKHKIKHRIKTRIKAVHRKWSAARRAKFDAKHGRQAPMVNRLELAEDLTEQSTR